MQYLNERNAFFSRVMVEPISASARLLWLSLSYLINTRYSDISGVTVPVAMSTLKSVTGLSISSIERARDDLQEAGLIRWGAQAGRQSAVYEMVSFANSRIDAQRDVQRDAQREVQNDVQGEGQEAIKEFDAQNDAQNDVQRDAQREGIYRVYKDNRVLENELDDDEDIKYHADTSARMREDFAGVYRESFGYDPNSEEITRCVMWVNMGHSPELVKESLRRAALHHAGTPFAYAAECLESWRAKKISTLDQLIDHDFNRDVKRGKIKHLKKNNSSLFDVEV